MAVGATLVSEAPSRLPSMTPVRMVPEMRLGAGNVVGSPTNAEKICGAAVVLVTRMLLRTKGSGSKSRLWIFTWARPERIENSLGPLSW
jgi:hypothetical protein